MSTIRKNIVIASTAPGNMEPGIVALPRPRAMANAPVDHSFGFNFLYYYCRRNAI